jgi:hypothetical protein
MDGGKVAWFESSENRESCRSAPPLPATCPRSPVSTTTASPVARPPSRRARARPPTSPPGSAAASRSSSPSAPARSSASRDPPQPRPARRRMARRHRRRAPARRRRGLITRSAHAEGEASHDAAPRRKALRRAAGAGRRARKPLERGHGSNEESRAPAFRTSLAASRVEVGAHPRAGGTVGKPSVATVHAGARRSRSVRLDEVRSSRPADDARSVGGRHGHGEPVVPAARGRRDRSRARLSAAAAGDGGEQDSAKEAPEQHLVNALTGHARLEVRQTRVRIRLRRSRLGLACLPG